LPVPPFCCATVITIAMRSYSMRWWDTVSEAVIRSHNQGASQLAFRRRRR
jgi:hypothetical protein